MKPLLSFHPGEAALTALPPALGASGTVWCFFSYGLPDDAVLFACFTGLAVWFFSFCLFCLSRRLGFILLTAAFLAGMAALWRWSTGYTASALTASVSFIDILKAPYNLDIPTPDLPDPAMTAIPAAIAFAAAMTWLFTAASLCSFFRMTAVLLSMGLSLLGLYFGVMPPASALVSSAAFWVSALIPQKKAPLAGVWITISALAAAFLITAAVPENRYSQPQWMEKTRETIESLTSDWFGATFRGGTAFTSLLQGADGHGRLGDTDGLHYTGRPIVRIASAPVSSRLYLRSWSGAAYDKNQWHDLPDSAYDGVKDLFDHARGEWYDQAAWLMEIAAQDDTFRSRLLRQSQEDLSERKKPFSVPVVYEDTPYYFLPYDISFAAPIFAFDRSPRGTYAKAYETYRWDAPLSRLQEEILARRGGSSYLETYESMERLYRRFVYGTYLTVPEEIQKAFPKDAPLRKVTNQEDERRYIRELRSYFQSHYAYDQRPGRTPKGKDFVADFLNDSRRGYCVHFASAAVMLLRAAGIPARYVVGVTVGADELQSASLEKGLPTMDLDDHHAHAWAEIYVDGLGWRPVEMTPGMKGADDPIPEPLSEGNEGQPSSPEKAPPQEKEPAKEDAPNPQQPAPKPPLPMTTPSLPGQTDGPSSSASSVLFLLFLFLAMTAAAALLIMLRLRRVPRLLEKASAGDNRSFDWLVAYLFRLARFAGHGRNNESYRAWAALTEQDPRFAGITHFLSLAEKRRFSEVALSPSECREASDMARTMRKAVMANLSFWQTWRFLIWKGL